MLITKLKDIETIESLTSKKIFIINCHGCREVSFPEREAAELEQRLQKAGRVTGILTTDYICNPENMVLRLQTHGNAISEADMILVCSCGVGVQTIADYMPEMRVCAGCDTYALPGCQGVTPLEYDCDRCGQCYLNITGGICPITACSKSLVNGPCGGTKNGRCEVDPDMECGWERIYRRLKQLGREDAAWPVQMRSYDPAVQKQTADFHINETGA